MGPDYKEVQREGKLDDGIMHWRGRDKAGIVLLYHYDWDGRFGITRAALRSLVDWVVIATVVSRSTPSA